MRPATFLLPGALLLVSLPASAGITVIGSSSARLCYEAAESGGRSGMSECDKALFDDALSTHDRVATHVNRGILRLRSGDIDGAVEDFDTAIARDPEEAEAYLNKGLALMRRPDMEKAALPLLDLALEKKTKKPALAYFARGIAYENLGNVSLAYRNYRSASAADPQWNQPRAELTRFKVR